ncbi:MAG: alpha/beta hydrolase [Ichthyobacteriaceae bacterium]|nr:alpha/beta hydrolase [Ichthyobacteriaceae bacterium]
MSWIKIVISVFILLVILYYMGPKPSKPVYDETFTTTTSNLIKLTDSITQSENAIKNIKPNNNAEIVFFNNALKNKTKWSVVYLHGFSASSSEADPIHKWFAKKYGMNLYLARLSNHGLKSEEALLNLTSDELWQTAKEALAVGEQLGENVILMSTSTGGSLALKLAAVYPEKVSALINFSPNIRINSPAAFLLNKPWGLQILKFAKGGNYNITGTEDEESAKYWNNKYRIEAIVNLQQLVETTMTKKTFNDVTCPSLTIAYYKDEENQDKTVKVSAQEWMNNSISTPDKEKRFVKLAKVGAHPLASKIYSKDLNSVRITIDYFIKDILNIE